MSDSLSDRLQARIRVDLLRNTATIFVRGRFTAINYRGLIPVIRRAHALPGHPLITIDITPTAGVDPLAADLLEAACGSLFPGYARLPLRIIDARRHSLTAHLEAHPEGTGPLAGIALPAAA